MFLSNYSEHKSMDIYERIKELCKKEGISLKEMLEKNGIVQSSYYSSQQAKRFPALPDLVAIAKHFKVSLDFLITGQEECDFPQEIRLLFAELDTLNENQKSFLMSSLQFQIDLFKKQSEKQQDF